jgi:ABC-type taurine transport system substrate-binding protein
MPSLVNVLRGLAAGVIGLVATSLLAQPGCAEEIRIGYQKSSTLTAILKTNGELEKALAPLGMTVTWREFTSGLPLLEAINIGSVDFGDAATIEEANSHRSYLVGPVTALSLSEQQRIADAFFAEHLIPAKLDTAALKIWTPKGP